MCALCREAGDNHATMARRHVLKFAVATAGLAIVPRAFAKAGAKKTSAKPPPKPENVLSPDAALDRLMAGNKRYAAGVGRRYDFQQEREALSGGQNPFAAVLSCADSRIAPEFCFDVARGDVFVCRVAGNFATDEITASFEYAVQVLNAPLIMVLGHDGCGAVDATIKSLQDGTTLPGHLPSLVHQLAPAVQAAQTDSGDLLANAIRRNVTLNVARLRNSTPILQRFADDNKLHVVGGIYRLKTGQVELVG